MNVCIFIDQGYFFLFLFILIHSPSLPVTRSSFYPVSASPTTKKISDLFADMVIDLPSLFLSVLGNNGSVDLLFFIFIVYIFLHYLSYIIHHIPGHACSGQRVSYLLDLRLLCIW